MARFAISEASLILTRFFFYKKKLLLSLKSVISSNVNMAHLLSKGQGKSQMPTIPDTALIHFCISSKTICI